MTTDKIKIDDLTSTETLSFLASMNLTSINLDSESLDSTFSYSASE